MKLLILSDLHLELGGAYAVPADLDFDVVVLAGDIHCPGSKAVHWAQKESTFGGRPVMLVAGNHEFYGRELRAELGEMKRAAAGSNVHILDREHLDLDGVRFVGCTLWTDFQLPVQLPGGSSEVNLDRALFDARERMSDYRQIKLTSPLRSANHSQEHRRLLQPEDTLAMHGIDRDWLHHQLLEPFDGPTVVVTHHAPAASSVAERYAQDWLTPSFVSALPASFFERPQLWVHGHTHSPFDYVEGSCRVVSNPRGYRMGDGGSENRQFDRGFVVHVA
ncbi:metallophosphoesterase [Roseateles sp.]|uniref:metallophosphoesterase n=1 Tax=Roseateles sp. TaxID=1971397 RepID=UPI0039EC495E